MIARLRPVLTRAALTSVLASAGLALGMSAPASAVATPRCASLAVASGNSFSCTVDPGDSVGITLKAGNGGLGGSGGPGGFGGLGWDGTAAVAAGRGAIGMAGGIGGAGTRLQGTYTNATNATVTISVTVGANGVNGTLGTIGTAGISALPVGPANDGTDGTDGGNGGNGGNGSVSTFSVDGNVIVTAGAGTGGLGGIGGNAGTAGLGNGTVGTDGAAPVQVSAPPGANGSYQPQPLPTGWTTTPSAPFEPPLATLDVPPLFAALAPQRLLDTRDTTPIVGGDPAREIETAGVAGVPVDATAVVLNVTATGSTEPGYVTVYPCGQDLPKTSTVNFAAGQTVANAATVTLLNGKVCVYSKSTTHVVLDVNGAYSGSEGTDTYDAVTPARLLDSRDNAGAKIAASTVTEIPVAGLHGVPADASAVVLNVTVTAPDNDGYTTLFPCGVDAPTASNVNYVAGQTVPNQVTVAVGANGKVCAISNAGTHLVVDVNGAYSPNGGSLYEALTPDRLLDTREGTTRLVAGTPFELTVGGQVGVDPAASAAALNVTVTNPAGAGYVTVFPCGTTPPLASNLNFVAGQDVANAVTAGLTAGKTCIVSTVDTDLVVDVSGQFLSLVS